MYDNVAVHTARYCKEWFEIWKWQRYRGLLQAPIWTILRKSDLSYLERYTVPEGSFNFVPETTAVVPEKWDIISTDIIFHHKTLMFRKFLDSMQKKWSKNWIVFAACLSLRETYLAVFTYIIKNVECTRNRTRKMIVRCLLQNCF